MRPSLGLVFILLVGVLASCGVKDEGLGSPPDAATGGTTGTVACGASVVDKGNWPAKSSYAACSQACGPDDLGSRTCSQVQAASCKASSGCVCVDTLCASCGACVFPSLPDCYRPTNAPSAAEIPACDKAIRKGAACGTVCNRKACLQEDGKTACLCNNVGRYACAPWGENTWK